MSGWIGNWSYLLWFFVGTTAALHLLFWWWPLSDRRNRIVNWLAVLFAGAGIIPATYQSNAVLAARELDQVRPRLEASRTLIVDQIAWLKQYECETKFVRDEYSPPNFEQIVERQQQACVRTSQIVAAENQWLRPTGHASFPRINAPIRGEPALVDSLRFIGARLIEYNAEAREVLRLESRTRTGDVEVTLAVYGPFIAVFALALGLAAVAFPSPGLTRPANLPRIPLDPVPNVPKNPRVDGLSNSMPADSTPGLPESRPEG